MSKRKKCVYIYIGAIDVTIQNMFIQYAYYFVALCVVILQLCDAILHHILGCVKVYMF